MSKTNSGIKRTRNLHGVVLFGRPSEPGPAESARKLKLAGREYLFEEEDQIAADLVKQKEIERIDEMIKHCQKYIKDLRDIEDPEPFVAEHIRIEEGMIEILKEKKQFFQA